MGVKPSFRNRDVSWRVGRQNWCDSVIIHPISLCNHSHYFLGNQRVIDSAMQEQQFCTGNKTKNGALGVKRIWKPKLTVLLLGQKNKGCRVGISTSVSVDHATPAAFTHTKDKEAAITTWVWI